MLKLFDYQQNLVNQARNSLAKGNQSVLIVSPPGSGKSIVIAEIARLTAKKGGRILFFVHRKELVQQIKQTFIRQSVDLSHCTIDTVMRVKNRLKILPRPTLIIVDEGHHSRAKSYQAIFDYFSKVPRLGFTATPWRLSGQGFNDIYSDMVEGPSVDWLIKHQHLAPYVMYGKSLGNLDKLKIGSTGDYTSKSVEEFEKSVIHGDIIKSWQKFAQDRKTIVYSFSINFSKQVAKEFNKAGISAIHVDSKTPTAQREQIMADFKTGKIKVLCNVDLVSEGFDVPDCSCVVMLRPTKSLVLYLQQSMRAMRYQPGKKAVIIDQVSNFAEFGLPDDDREWSLQGHSKRQTQENTVMIKECPQCYAVIKAGSVSCPYCDYDFSEEIERARKIEIEKQEKLQRIKREEAFKVNYILTKKVSELNTMEELKGYQKAKGYKPGWVYHMAKLKGLLK
ncbi:DEAD/DEAH box helicase family protein [Lactobacillus sp. ESL0680]|uniref:DEAD/DEAH box helicase n=1 Tax=Lactobacillus sp. ESL0680 TaxID=2983210 RepID=UPI0023F63A6C|nr:DEAD/DEAH box helicase family protein [Lactobacillus sp. ESL0680]WEV39251.1 DEAD/DEAH box helicase family protein [Lactobacillus sp. ESL0680]